MAVYAVIPPGEIAIDEAVKSSTATKFRDNPLAVTQGDPTALAAGEGVAIDFDFGAGPQTSIITDETDIDKALTPDGLGGAQWRAGLSGLILLQRIELAAPATFIDFLGLAGETEETYLLQYNCLTGSVAGHMKVRENGTDAGAGLNDAGNFVLGRFITTAGNFVKHVYGEIIIEAREVVGVTTKRRSFYGKAVEGVNILDVAPVQKQDWACTQRLAGALTSVGMGAQNAGFYAAGSVFRLFKFAQTP